MKRNKLFMTIILVLVAILISSSMITVSAAETTYTIVETEGKGIMRILKFDNGEYVYCVDRHVKRPVVGCQYKEIEAPSDFNINDIEKAVFVLGKHQEDSYEFRIATQCFLWSVIENEDLSHEVGQFVGADWDKAKTICDTLLADFNTITEYEKYDIRFYEYIEKPDEYQRLIGYVVSSADEENPIIPPDETEPIIPDEEPSVPDEPIEPELVPNPDGPYYPDAPQTSDDSNITLYVILLFTSLIGLVALSLVKRKS